MKRAVWTPLHYHARAFIHAYVHTDVCADTYRYAFPYTYAYARKRLCTYAYTYTYRNICAHTCAHAHTDALIVSQPPSLTSKFHELFWAPCKAPKVHIRHKKTIRNIVFWAPCKAPERAREISYLWRLQPLRKQLRISGDRRQTPYAQLALSVRRHRQEATRSSSHYCNSLKNWLSENNMKIAFPIYLNNSL